MASVATCPHCGADLYALRDFALGQLSVESGTIIRWQGHKVTLTRAERLLILALARADGAAIGRDILAESTGYEGEKPSNVVAVLIHRAEKAFRAIDPLFDAIENVWGVGLRWRTEQDHLLAA